MRLFISLVEQGLASALTFGVSLWLIHTAPGDSYGIYVFWYAVALLSTTGMGALTAVHLFPLLPGRAHLADRREPERVLLSATLLLLIVVAVAAALASRLLSGGLGQIASVIFLPGFLVYQYARALAISRGQVAVAAALAAVVAVLAALGFAAARMGGIAPDAGTAMLIVGLAYGLPGSGVLAWLSWCFGASFRPSVLRGFLPYLDGSRWIFLGAASSEAIIRLYSFVVVAWFGPMALGRLSAAQVVVRPAWMLSGAWMSVGRPKLAVHCRNRDRDGLLGTIWQGVLLTTASSLAWSVVTVAAWPYIAGWLYHGRYADADGLVALWGANVVLGAIAAPMNIALQAMGKYRALGYLDIVAAGVCAASTLLLLGHFDYAYAIVAMLLGQATQIVAMAAVMFANLRRPAWGTFCPQLAE
jgi:O-antigen/teichoic acid export membrane protein